MLRKGIIFLAFLATVSFLREPLLKAEVVDKILVVINDEIITQGEIDRIIMPVYEEYRKQYSGTELAERVDQARYNVLQTLIQDKLLLSEARRKKIEVGKSDVEAKIAEVKKRFATDEEFKAALEQENLVVGDLEKKYNERVMIDKLIQSEIGGSISLPPQEIISFYEANKEHFKDPKKIKVRSILIRVSDERSKEDAFKLANEVLARLKDGCNFELMAKTYSDGPYKENGGDMGWVRDGELMEALNDQIFSLEKGNISDTVPTNLGFHIFMAEAIEEPRVKDFSEVKGRIETMLYNQKMQDKLVEFVEELKKNAYIAFK